MDLKSRAKEILQIQSKAVTGLEAIISGTLIQAIQKITSMKGTGGRVITTGMGKAGIIAGKMSATLSSIGLPSFFVSPAESGHGDLGRITPNDLMIVFSNSGSTIETVSMIEHVHTLNKNKNFVITICGVPEPKVPSNIVIDYGKVPESCVVSKVPSTSTTVMLVIADILAITAAESLGLNDDWFKIRHPGGAIGVAYSKKDRK